MREAVECAVRIFHGSIMAIQSGGRGGSAGGICRFDVGATRFIPSRGERRDVLSNVLSIYPGGIPPVFSFRFRATERRKVRDGVLVERGSGKRRGGGGGGKENATAAVQTGLASLPSHCVAHFGHECEVKRDENGLLRNLWSGYT